MINRLQKIEKAINSMSDDKFNDLLNDLGVKEERQWLPKCGEPYWVISISGHIANDVWGDSFEDNYRLLMNNVFKTKEEALAQRDFNLEKAKLIKEIEDSSDIIAWGEDAQGKYSLFYDHVNKGIYTDAYWDGEVEGSTYTTNLLFLENLIKNEPERIKKYLFGIGERE